MEYDTIAFFMFRCLVFQSPLIFYRLFFQTSQKIKTRTAAEIIPGNDKGVII
jgi:hypothetical protein